MKQGRANATRSRECRKESELGCSAMPCRGSFSDARGPLRPSRDLISLGERIVAEFGLDQSTDTLGRWMAHRVAELMERAEHARTKAARI
jgi:hypothetical protein